MGLNELVNSAIGDFRQVAALAEAEFATDGISIEISNKPHKTPTKLPTGKVAIYAFFLEGQALKIGLAGQKSAARYLYQHYNGKAPSTLRGSIINSPKRVGAGGVAPEAVGDWIKLHTDRVNLLISATSGVPLLRLFEAFLHVRWNPIFEGRLDEPES